ncbi:uncharacterized protein LOC116295761 isoform X2 [Actinia tenebrosa]|uniref:Uncharacterized protein LOC116295761 isoform X2 n=1 Tax=Actinia tenebrosa TaxID=6105 RepID=A0A6P8HVY4_ACTTE|nr:uncharacterized protein LOC116295761 isoform X2 [Actinia tenebrosa]
MEINVVENVEDYTEAEEPSQNPPPPPPGLFSSNNSLVYKDQRQNRIVQATNFTVKVLNKFEDEKMQGYIFEIKQHARGRAKTWSCALSMQQLCNTQSVFAALQYASKNSLWYKLPKDAPGSSDLALYMFSLGQEFDSVRDESNIIKKVVTKFPSWQQIASNDEQNQLPVTVYVVSEDTQIDVTNKKVLEGAERIVCLTNNKDEIPTQDIRHHVESVVQDEIPPHIHNVEATIHFIPASKEGAAEGSRHGKRCRSGSSKLFDKIHPGILKDKRVRKKTKNKDF